MHHMMQQRFAEVLPTWRDSAMRLQFCQGHCCNSENKNGSKDETGGSSVLAAGPRRLWASQAGLKPLACSGRLFHTS